MRQKGAAPVIKHAGIAESLRAQIKRGAYRDRLPSRRGLARLFHVNLKTMDKALVTLRKERVVLSCNGLGVFVHPRLKGQVVSECFLVFAGHRAIADPANPCRFLLAHVLEQLLNAAHDLHVELRFLPISPLNNDEINWTLLQHLKKNDYTLFLGVQYWNVIRKLARRGCRCLVFSDNPANSGFDADGMPLMSVNIDYLAMMQTLTDYFLRYSCRHPAAVLVSPWVSRRFSSPILKKLSFLCRRKGMKFSLLNGTGQSLSDDKLADGLKELLRETPPVDAIFTTLELDACRIRDVLDKRFPSNSPSVRIIGYDVHGTWRGDNQGVDALHKPLDEMIRHILKVVCGTLPFKPGFLPFPAVLEMVEGGKHVKRSEEGEATKAEYSQGCF